MGHSYASQEQDTFSRIIKVDYDSDTDSQSVGIYEVEEKSQEMHCERYTNSRYQSSTLRGQISTEHRPFNRHNISYVRGVTSGNDLSMDGLSSLFQKTATNLLGRDTEEASAEFALLLRSSRHSPRHKTPSLISDDTGTSSRTSSSSYSPARSIHREIQAQPPSPGPVSSLSKVIEKDEVPEEAVAWVEARTVSADGSSSSVQAVQESPSPLVCVEEASIVVMSPGVILRTPLPRTQPPKLTNQNLSPFSPADRQPLSRISSGAPSTVQPLATILFPEDNSGEDILDEEKEHDCVPVRDRPSRATKWRNPKPGTIGFKCPQCNAGFTRNYDMLRHIQTIHEAQTYDKLLARTCPCCLEVLSRKDAFKRHILRVPEACIRYAKLQGRTFEPNDDQQLLALCRAGKPPLAELPSRTVG